MTSSPSTVMLKVFDAGPTLFRSGWFVESLATQTLVIFVIRTRRVPFFRSRPSLPLLVTHDPRAQRLAVAIPYIPFIAKPLGFTSPYRRLSARTLLVMVITYLGLAQVGVALFFAPGRSRPLARPDIPRNRRIRRRSARWSLWPAATRRIHRAAAGKLR